MRVALYLRKSTDEQADSIETQRSNAEAWCTSQGWTVATSFIDSGISRTEFAPARRRGWTALLDAAKRRDFDIVVARDLSRIGGNIGRALVWVEDLLATGARLYSYSDGCAITQDNALQCIMNALKFYGAQGEVEAIRSRTREALFTKARDGKVAGGACFGYRNQPSKEQIRTKRGMRPAYVERVIDAKEAKIVRSIFDAYAGGKGLRTIAKSLNARGVPSPRAGKRGGGSWAPSAIHAMLRRDLYVGRIVYGKTRKEDLGGTRRRGKRADCDLVIVDAPHLRIITQELWDAAHAKMPKVVGRKRGGRPATYMLSGILRCAGCGGPLSVINGRDSYDAVKVYTCARRRDRGGSVCDVSLRRDVRAVDDAVLTWVRDNVLSESFVLRILGEVRKRIGTRAKEASGEISKLEKDAAKLRNEIDRYAEMALEAPGAARTVFYNKVSERQAELEDIESRLRSARTTPAAIDLEVRRLERQARERLAELRKVVGRNDAEARALVAALFPRGLVAQPIDTAEGRKMRVEGVAVAGKALGLDVGNSASPAGTDTLPCELVA